MPYSRTDLITEVLDLLGVTQTGQPQDPDDAAKVDAKITPTLATLQRRGVILIQDPDNIDDEYFNSIAVIVANNVGPKFGQSFDQGTDAIQEALLREMQAEPGADDVVRADYF